MSDTRPAPPETEIEITPEMIEAGRKVVSEVWIEFTDLGGGRLWGEVLCGVFRAMMEARHKSAS